MHVTAGDVVIAVASKADANCMMLLHFLHEFKMVLKAYFIDGEVTESAVR